MALYQHGKQIAGVTNSASKVGYTEADGNKTTVQAKLNELNNSLSNIEKNTSSTLSISATDEIDFIKKLMNYVKSTYGTNYGIKHLAGDWQGYYWASADVNYFNDNIMYGQVYFPQITKNAYRFFTDNGGASIEIAPFKSGETSIELVGSYAGNQTIDVSQYLRSEDTIDNFIVELTSIGSSSSSSGSDSRGTSYWGNNISCGGSTLSKSISGTNLVISGAAVGASCGSTSREWSGTKANASCSSAINYKVWHV